ncbi:TonB-dependent receptor, partial [candidate division WOR-3 bacterium]|nr:TonB-dependent receptor [candidate division WOR-3 bacterium]
TASIAGRVLDAAEKTPIEFANVVLYHLPDSEQVTGTVTDASGSFTLAGVKPGRYRLEISFIGCRPRTVEALDCAPDARLDLGTLSLEQAPVPVSGVEATAEKPAFTYELDRKVIEVSKLPNASTGTAVDALRNVPSVKVDIEDNVTLRGSSNFKVQIDGRPSDLDGSDALKQIPAATIEKIELITNPSAKYAPDGSAGIINVILKKQKGTGISSLANTNAGLDRSYGGDLLVGYKQGIVDAHLGGNLGRWNGVSRGESERRVFGATETLHTRRSNAGTWNPAYGGVRAGLGLALGPRDKTTLTGRYGGFDFARAATGTVTERHLPGGSTREYRTAHGWSWDNRYMFGMVDHEHTFDTTAHRLAGRAYFVMREGLNTSLEQEMTSGGDTTRGRRTEDEGPWQMLKFESEYTLPIREGSKLEAGLEAQLRSVDQDYRVLLYDTLTRQYYADSLSSHPYLGTENIYSAYVTWSWNWRKLGVQPGLRGELGDRVIRVPGMDSTWQVGRFDPFPTLHLSYGLPANQQVTASYSRRINRPDPYQLRPFLTWQNAYSANKGNPSLRPDYVNSWEAGYEVPLGANNLTAEVYY